jgi:plasmid replication initiation protein
MSGGLERAIYRIARKHAGDQAEGWVVRISVLAEKTGSESPLKQFSYLLRKIAAKGGLLDYDIAFEDANDGSAAVRYHAQGGRRASGGGGRDEAPRRGRRTAGARGPPRSRSGWSARPSTASIANRSGLR